MQRRSDSRQSYRNTQVAAECDKEGRAPCTLYLPRPSRLQTPNIIYILSLGQMLQHHGFSYHFYADDILIYMSCKPSLATQIKKKSVCMQYVKTWLNSNFVKLAGGVSDFWKPMLIFKITKTNTPLPQKGLAPILIAPPHTYVAYTTQAMISSVKQSKTNATPCLHRMRAARQNTIEVIIISDAVYTGCCAVQHNKSPTENCCRILFMTF